jgi:isopentenyl diphosphate isomerase/L-lactate dehydrogenase-like FMN-dependent dehydrogenase
VKRFRDRWPRKLLLKGVLRADDAGARSRSASMASCYRTTAGAARRRDQRLDALPEVVRAVGGRTAILVDGGVRRGSDIAAVALGAEACCSAARRSTASPPAAERRRPRDRDPRGRARPHAGDDRLPQRRGTVC